MAEICVIGGGPAGSTFAARMAQLGHEVTLVERARFPRRHLGESLTPGVLPLLAATGARQAVEVAGFPRAHKVLVQWEGKLHLREDARDPGLLVDRGEFDRLLLKNAKAVGVRVLQPARALERRRRGDGDWTVDVATEHGALQLHADFVAEAGGRCSQSQRRRLTGCRTLALYGYWRGSDLPREPRIEAGAGAWYWGVPLPDGSYNTLAFVDLEHFRATRRGAVGSHFIELLGRFGLLAGCRDARLDGAVQAIDATPYLDEESVTPTSIRVGEAALALDPLSSSGVQKAIQSALAAAVVANTLLRKPASGDIALRFYRSHLEEVSARHARWAASHYGTAAAMRSEKLNGDQAAGRESNRERFGDGKFWQDRASGAEANPPHSPGRPPTPIDALRLSTTGIALSPQLEFVDLPCIEGDFVTLKNALRHPNLEAPIAYLGGRQLAPLLHRVPPGSTLLGLAQAWSGRIPLESGLAIAAWLFNNGLVVEGPPCASPLHDLRPRVAEDPRP